MENNSEVVITYKVLEGDDFVHLPLYTPTRDLTPRQIRRGLNSIGITVAMVDSIIEQLPEPDRSNAKIDWEYATSYSYDNPLLIAVGTALGLDREQIKTLWSKSAKL